MTPKRIAVPGAVAILVLVLVGRPAAAEPPVTTVQDLDRTFTFDCPGFTLVTQYTGTETIRRLAVAQQTQVRVFTSFTNSATGEVFRSTDAWMYTFADDVSVVGMTLRVTIPGVGIVALEGGRVIYSIETGEVTFDSGPSVPLTNWCMPFA